MAATKTKHNKRGGGYLITSWAGGARDMWRRRREPAPGWSPSRAPCSTTSTSTRAVISFYECGGVISQGQLQLVQDQRTLSLRGCSRVARQAPMWVVVRPARSEKKATCWPWGSVKMQLVDAGGEGGRSFLFLEQKI